MAGCAAYPYRDEKSRYSDTEAFREHDIYECFQQFADRVTGRKETDEKWMDKEKILVRIFLWSMEHRNSEIHRSDIWEILVRDFGQEYLGGLIAEMNGTLLRYSGKEDDLIRLTPLGKSVTIRTVSQIFRNCTG